MSFFYMCSIDFYLFVVYFSVAYCIGRDGKHNYLFVIEEPSIFKEPVTYVDLRVRYQRL
jgi:hypothetical protein